MLNKIFEKIDNNIGPDKNDLIYLLEIGDPVLLESLYKKAYEVKLRYVGNKVYLRGLIELSNICDKNCYYCGIRKGNKAVKRYMMTRDEIIEAAMYANNNKFGSIVLQSGERSSPDFVDFIAGIVETVKSRTDGAMGITLCLGEQTEEVYRRWFAAGAHRYLLRIETSNPNLYRRLHPEDHNFDRRLECLETLKKIGFQTGTGVMSGLPFQTADDLAGDILFFKKMDIDMIGMGPYIVHKDTPLASEMPDFENRKDKQLNIGLKMIAATRLFLKDVNIASTTALQSLHPRGRELGLKAGANVIMPNITSPEYKNAYLLYENKPCSTENNEACGKCLEKRIQSIGETIAYGEWGDSPHFHNKNRKA